jgi:excisionase family DNA binding protein
MLAIYMNRAEQIPEEPYNLTKIDAAEFLGIKVTTVNKWVIDRKLPHIKLHGRLVRFRRSDLVRFAEDQRVA